MRTISATVSTSEEADAMRRRLEALGVERDRILFKEAGAPAGDASIFVTVKVAPNQVEAATDILRGGGARSPAPLAEPDSSTRQLTPAAFPPPLPARDRGTGVPPVEPPAQPAESMERRSTSSQARPVPGRGGQPKSVRLARMAAIAALLAGLGFAVGAALGTLV